MPRLSSLLIRKARAANPLLPHLLRTCRDLPSASNELRWLREHVYQTQLFNVKSNGSDDYETVQAKESRLKELCRQRGLGVPLQHLIGTEYFGGLEIVCSPRALIPRQETAEIVLELARRLQAGIKKNIVPQPLLVLDLCCGTGCMGFLFHTELQKMYPAGIYPTSTLGVDFSGAALHIARLNRSRLGLCKRDSGDTWQSPINFIKADVLAPSTASGEKPRSPRSVLDLLHERPEWRNWDIVIANPPYISQAELDTTRVERSVRNFEPRIALVPPGGALGDAVAARYESSLNTSELLNRADLFYPPILDIASRVGAKIMMMEIGGPEQASRVRDMAIRSGIWDNVEIWRDGMSPGGSSSLGNERAVVCWRGQGAEWIN